MSRIPVAHIDTQHPLYETLKNIEQSMGFMLNDGLLMAHMPEIASAFAALTKSILFSGTIDPVMKRLMGLLTSLSSGCTYCMSHTAYSAEKMNLPLEKIEAVWSYKTSSLFTIREKNMLDLAYKSSVQPNGIKDTDISSLSNYFTDAEIIELVSVVSLYAFLNRFNQTLATTPEDIPMSTLSSLKTMNNE